MNTRKLTMAQATAIRAEQSTAPFPSLREIGEKYKVERSIIARICSGKTYKGPIKPKKGTRKHIDNLNEIACLIVEPVANDIGRKE